MTTDLKKRFDCADLHIGVGCQIDETVQITKAKKVVIGDHCVIGPHVRIIGGEFVVGDYSKIHNHTYIYSQSFVRLGHLSWIGQGTTLDGTGGITAGHYLGAGINSALYSHIRHGDVMEGCRFDQNKELVIGDDVWFVGMCLVSPVRVADKSVAFLGSVVTKDMKENHVYGGNPAVDLTEKVGPPWKQVSIDQKIEMMRNYLTEYQRQCDSSFDPDMIAIVDTLPDRRDDRTYYDVTTRQFTKTNRPPEVAFNKWLFPYRGKFRPYGIDPENPAKS